MTECMCVRSELMISALTDSKFQSVEQTLGTSSPSVFFFSHVQDGSSLAPLLCHLVSEELVTRLSRSDMMGSDGSFLQNSSLPLIQPYQKVNPSSYSMPLKPLRILELTSRANRVLLIKDHLASVQISLIECQSGMFAWQREGKWAIV